MPKKQPTKARDENWRKKKEKKEKKKKKKKRKNIKHNQSSADCTVHMNTTVEKKVRHKLVCCRQCVEQLSLGYVFCCDVICVMDLFLSSLFINY